MEEENGEDTPHAAAKVRFKNGTAPWERGDVSLSVVRHFAEQNGVMFVIADHASYRDKICGNLLALMLDTNCIHG